jgi:hypothetical protein
VIVVAQIETHDSVSGVVAARKKQGIFVVPRRQKNSWIKEEERGIQVMSNVFSHWPTTIVRRESLLRVPAIVAQDTGCERNHARNSNRVNYEVQHVSTAKRDRLTKDICPILVFEPKHLSISEYFLLNR